MIKIKAYKLVQLKKDGKLYPLFINKKVHTPIGEWLQAECHPTKGFAVRQGWHCCLKPYAPHLKIQLSNGQNRVWVEVEIDDFEYYDRPASQGGKWVLAQKMKIIRVLDNKEVGDKNARY